VFPNILEGDLYGEGVAFVVSLDNRCELGVSYLEFLGDGSYVLNDSCGLGVSILGIDAIGSLLGDVAFIVVAATAASRVSRYDIIVFLCRSKSLYIFV
jgi:hypothetical protein